MFRLDEIMNSHDNNGFIHLAIHKEVVFMLLLADYLSKGKFWILAIEWIGSFSVRSVFAQFISYPFSGIYELYIIYASHLCLKICHLVLTRESISGFLLNQFPISSNVMALSTFQLILIFQSWDSNLKSLTFILKGTKRQRSQIALLIDLVVFT